MWADAWRWARLGLWVLCAYGLWRLFAHSLQVLP